ncbi:MAG: rhodanese-like domain-containing protein [Desulfobacteraceae bacterium]|nr:rhodanese-like domain-containing protein [Desulfobacteraceae bacterium]
MKALRIIICLVMFFFQGMICSAMAETQTFKKISAPEVKNMFERGNTVLVDVLSKIEYDMQHITGSITIPIIKMETTNKLPKDKDTPLIFYCMGLR